MHKRKPLFFIIPILMFLLTLGCSSLANAFQGLDDSTSTQPDQTNTDESSAEENIQTQTVEEISTDNTPEYFIAVHCEPNNYSLTERQENLIVESYESLKRITDYADQYNIKLTIMFSPQLAEYILADTQKMEQLLTWQTNGHEIALHHHSIYHGNWDGYTDQPQLLANQMRKQIAGSIEPYWGTLEEMMTIVLQLDQAGVGVISACANDEVDKQALPDVIIYDTCSGFANAGEPGVKMQDLDPLKGVNEFISTGYVNGIQRWWLTHVSINNFEHEASAEESFSMISSPSVFGAITHAKPAQENPYNKWIDFVHSRDPEGIHSKTVRQIMEEGTLPIEELDEALLLQVDIEGEALDPRNPCGDGTCDALEQNNSELCPQDCTE